MDQSITLALIGIVPAIAASIVTYSISSKKTKVDLIKIINQSNDKLRLEVKEKHLEIRWPNFAQWLRYAFDLRDPGFESSHWQCYY